MKNRNFNDLIASYVDEPARAAKVSAKASNITLSLGSLKLFSDFLSSTPQVIKFKPRAFKMTASKVLVVLRNANPEVDIEYSDGLMEDNELVHKSSKPLWVLSKDSSGAFTIQKAR